MCMAWSPELLAALAAGSSVVCTPGFDAAAFFGWLKEFRPTWYTAVPAIHQAVLSAAGVDKQQRPAVLVAADSFGLFVSAAQRDERAGSAVWCPRDRYLRHDGSRLPDCRKPFASGESLVPSASPPGPEIAILDSEGRRLPAGKRGEIALRGPPSRGGTTMMPPLPRPHFGTAGSEPATLDTWTRTDTSSLSAASRRSSIGEGKKSRPPRSRQALLSHPDVVEAAVFPVPHGRLGADVAAAVVLRQDAKVERTEAARLCPRTPGRFKVPGLIRIVPEIPKGAGGKDQAQPNSSPRFQ